MNSTSSFDGQVTSTLSRYHLSRSSRRKIRRKVKDLKQAPANLELWVKQEIERRHKARQENEVRRRKREARRELERLRATPRMKRWQISALAAGKLRRREMHPDDQEAVAVEIARIGKLRRVRAARKTVDDPLSRFRQRLHAHARSLSVRRRQEAEKAFRRRVGGLRRRKSLSTYGRLLLYLHDAQRASDRAKSRAANGRRFSDYIAEDLSDYAEANYRRSREARSRDYYEKEWHLDEACAAAEKAGVTFGWKDDGAAADAPWTVYFEITAGQVSFHTTERGPGPAFAGHWDGQQDVSASRICAAIEELLDATEA